MSIPEGLGFKNTLRESLQPTTSKAEKPNKKERSIFDGVRKYFNQSNQEVKEVDTRGEYKPPVSVDKDIGKEFGRN